MRAWLATACAVAWASACGDSVTLSFGLSVSVGGDGTGRVTSAPSGIDCGGTCSAVFVQGTTVGLTAMPAADSSFTGWSGDCAGASVTSTVLLSGARQCTATFAKVNPLLTVTLAGSAGSVASIPSGIDCGASCSSSFTYGDDVALMAAPGPGSTFAGWSGDCSAATLPMATVTMTAARSCTATFEPVLRVGSTGSGAGSVSSSPAGIDCGASCGAGFPLGTSVTLTALPALGASFVGWSGDCSGSDPTASVDMTTARTCIASFSFAGAAHIPFPQMPFHGTAPLTRLQLVTVTFGDYPYRDFVESFGDYVVHSQWLATVTKDYGAVTATHLAKVNLPMSQTLLPYDAVVYNNIGGLLPYPADHEGLVYLFYQPTPCSTGGGYHSYVVYNGAPVIYGVALNCGDGRGAEGVASHEIAEIMSDQLPGPSGGIFFDASSAPWVGEVGDICNSYPWWLEGGFRFEPEWSNSAAASGGSPCVPWVGGHPYVNVSPSPSTPQTVAAGGSAVFTLTGWSTATTGSWSLSVNAENYASQGFDSTPQLSPSTISNGTTATLTMHVPVGTSSGRVATVRVHSILPDIVEGVGSFSADWSFQVIAQ